MTTANASQKAVIVALKATFARTMGPRTLAIFEEELADADRPTAEEVEQGQQDAHEALVEIGGIAFPVQHQPPSNQGAEQAVLAALMIDGQALWKVDGKLDANHFADPAHRSIYACIQSLIFDGKMVSPAIVSAALAPDILKDLGGDSYFAKLIMAYTKQVPIKHYAEGIIDAWKRREMIALAERLSEQIANLSSEAFGLTGEGRDAEQIASDFARWLSSSVSEALFISRGRA